MIRDNFVLSSESVTSGHPDKLSDKISDAILDAIYTKDRYARVACETAIKGGTVFVFGEISTKVSIDIQKVVRDTIRKVYDNPYYGFDADRCGIITSITEQSPDIAQGVVRGKFGAGDQGLMFGYACNETPEFMPLPITLAHKLVMELEQARRNCLLPYLRPDGKSQVSVEYVNGKPERLTNVVIAAHHSDSISIATLRKDIFTHIILPVCSDWLEKSKTKIIINGTGKFVIGGPVADAGLTGRKIIVDTYGGMGRHGGGCFSGKDPSKVDRSASYMARYIAKNIVAAGLSDACEVQLAYCIGVPEPTSVDINTFGTKKVSDKQLIKAVKEIFPLNPNGIIRHLNLRSPIYEKTATYGHFGRNCFSWEKTDMVDKLLKKVGKYGK